MALPNTRLVIDTVAQEGVPPTVVTRVLTPGSSRLVISAKCLKRPAAVESRFQIAVNALEKCRDAGATLTEVENGVVDDAKHARGAKLRHSAAVRLT